MLLSKLEESSKSEMTTGIFRMFFALLFFIGAAVLVGSPFPFASAICWLVGACFQFNALLHFWRAMQYKAATDNVAVMQVFSQSPRQQSTPSDHQDSYDFTRYKEIKVSVDNRHSKVTPIPNQSYPCGLDTAGSWSISSPIGTIHIPDGAHPDYEAIRKGLARVELPSTLELDPSGRVRAVLAIPSSKLISNTNAA